MKPAWTRMVGQWWKNEDQAEEKNLLIDSNRHPK
jgi:hypothetical protein